jgi:hypothetical protein
MFALTLTKAVLPVNKEKLFESSARRRRILNLAVIPPALAADAFKRVDLLPPFLSDMREQEEPQQQQQAQCVQ